MKGATAQIDSQALQHNLAVVRSQIPANTKVVAVVKANAYGHGLVQVAKTLSSAEECRITTWKILSSAEECRITIWVITTPTISHKIR